MSECHPDFVTWLPAIIYVMLCIISIVATLFGKNTTKQKAINAGITTAWSVFWGIIIFLLCYYCHSGWAWFILLFPIIALIFIILIVCVGIWEIKQNQQSTL